MPKRVFKTFQDYKKFQTNLHTLSNKCQRSSKKWINVHRTSQLLFDSTFVNSHRAPFLHTHIWFAHFQVLKPLQTISCWPNGKLGRLFSQESPSDCWHRKVAPLTRYSAKYRRRILFYFFCFGPMHLFRIKNQCLLHTYVNFLNSTLLHVCTTYICCT
jgi:hypothetical protein